MDNRCVICGEIIPEGRLICPQCEQLPTSDRTLVSVEDVIETIRDIASYGSRLFTADYLIEELERRLL